MREMESRSIDPKGHVALIKITSFRRDILNGGVNAQVRRLVDTLSRRR